MKKLIIATALAAAVSPTANAFTGQELYDICTAKTDADHQMCTTYIKGVADGIMATEAVVSDKTGKMAYQLTNICWPEGWSGYQTRDITMRYMHKNGDVLRWPAGLVVMYSLRTAWACR